MTGCLLLFLTVNFSPINKWLGGGGWYHIIKRNSSSKSSTLIIDKQRSPIHDWFFFCARLSSLLTFCFNLFVFTVIYFFLCLYVSFFSVRAFKLLNCIFIAAYCFVANSRCIFACFLHIVSPMYICSMAKCLQLNQLLYLLLFCSF